MTPQDSDSDYPYDPYGHDFDILMGSRTGTCIIGLRVQSVLDILKSQMIYFMRIVRHERYASRGVQSGWGIQRLKFHSASPSQLVGVVNGSPLEGWGRCAEPVRGKLYDLRQRLTLLTRCKRERDPLRVILRKEMAWSTQSPRTGTNLLLRRSGRRSFCCCKHPIEGDIVLLVFFWL